MTRRPESQDGRPSKYQQRSSSRMPSNDLPAGKQRLCQSPNSPNHHFLLPRPCRDSSYSVKTGTTCATSMTGTTRTSVTSGSICTSCGRPGYPAYGSYESVPPCECGREVWGWSGTCTCDECLWNAENGQSSNVGTPQESCKIPRPTTANDADHHHHIEDFDSTVREVGRRKMKDVDMQVSAIINASTVSEPTASSGSGQTHSSRTPTPQSASAIRRRRECRQDSTGSSSNTTAGEGGESKRTARRTSSSSNLQERTMSAANAASDHRPRYFRRHHHQTSATHTPRTPIPITTAHATSIASDLTSVLRRSSSKKRKVPNERYVLMPEHPASDTPYLGSLAFMTVAVGTAMMGFMYTADESAFAARKHAEGRSKTYQPSRTQFTWAGPTPGSPKQSTTPHGTTPSIPSSWKRESHTTRTQLSTPAIATPSKQHHRRSSSSRPPSGQPADKHHFSHANGTSSSFTKGATSPMPNPKVVTNESQPSSNSNRHTLTQHITSLAFSIRSHPKHKGRSRNASIGDGRTQRPPSEQRGKTETTSSGGTSQRQSGQSAKTARSRSKTVTETVERQTQTSSLTLTDDEKQWGPRPRGQAMSKIRTSSGIHLRARPGSASSGSPSPAINPISLFKSSRASEHLAATSTTTTPLNVSAEVDGSPPTKPHRRRNSALQFIAFGQGLINGSPKLSKRTSFGTSATPTLNTVKAMRGDGSPQVPPRNSSTAGPERKSSNQRLRPASEDEWVRKDHRYDPDPTMISAIEDMTVTRHSLMGPDVSALGIEPPALDLASPESEAMPAKIMTIVQSTASPTAISPSECEVEISLADNETMYTTGIAIEPDPNLQPMRSPDDSSTTTKVQKKPRRRPSQRSLEKGMTSPMCADLSMTFMKGHPAIDTNPSAVDLKADVLGSSTEMRPVQPGTTSTLVDSFASTAVLPKESGRRSRSPTTSPDAMNTTSATAAANTTATATMRSSSQCSDAGFAAWASQESPSELVKRGSVKEKIGFFLRQSQEPQHIVIAGRAAVGQPNVKPYATTLNDDPRTRRLEKKVPVGSKNEQVSARVESKPPRQRRKLSDMRGSGSMSPSSTMMVSGSSSTMQASLSQGWTGSSGSTPTSGMWEGATNTITTGSHGTYGTIGMGPTHASSFTPTPDTTINPPGAWVAGQSYDLPVSSTMATTGTYEQASEDSGNTSTIPGGLSSTGRGGLRARKISSKSLGSPPHQDGPSRSRHDSPASMKAVYHPSRAYRHSPSTQASSNMITPPSRRDNMTPAPFIPSSHTTPSTGTSNTTTETTPSTVSEATATSDRVSYSPPKTPTPASDNVGGRRPSYIETARKRFQSLPNKIINDLMQPKSPQSPITSSPSRHRYGHYEEMREDGDSGGPPSWSLDATPPSMLESATMNDVPGTWKVPESPSSAARMYRYMSGRGDPSALLSGTTISGQTTETSPTLTSSVPRSPQSSTQRPSVIPLTHPASPPSTVRSEASRPSRTSSSRISSTEVDPYVSPMAHAAIRPEGGTGLSSGSPVIDYRQFRAAVSAVAAAASTSTHNTSVSSGGGSRNSSKAGQPPTAQTTGSGRHIWDSFVRRTDAPIIPEEDEEIAQLTALARHGSDSSTLSKRKVARAKDLGSTAKRRSPIPASFQQAAEDKANAKKQGKSGLAKALAKGDNQRTRPLPVKPIVTSDQKSKVQSDQKPKSQKSSTLVDSDVTPTLGSAPPPTGNIVDLMVSSGSSEASSSLGSHGSEYLRRKMLTQASSGTLSNGTDEADRAFVQVPPDLEFREAVGDMEYGVQGKNLVGKTTEKHLHSHRNRDSRLSQHSAPDMLDNTVLPGSSSSKFGRHVAPKSADHSEVWDDDFDFDESLAASGAQISIPNRVKASQRTVIEDRSQIRAFAIHMQELKKTFTQVQTLTRRHAVKHFGAVADLVNRYQKDFKDAKFLIDFANDEDSFLASLEGDFDLTANSTGVITDGGADESFSSALSGHYEKSRQAELLLDLVSTLPANPVPSNPDGSGSGIATTMSSNQMSGSTSIRRLRRGRGREKNKLHFTAEMMPALIEHSKPTNRKLGRFLEELKQIVETSEIESRQSQQRRAQTVSS